MEMYKTFETKDGINIKYCIIKKDESSSNYYILALHNKKQVGFCDFEIKNDTCNITRIVVTDKNYLGKGVGSIMFNAMERFCAINGANYVSGIFIPRGYENAWEITSKFYKNHNMKSVEYDFDYSDRDEIYKKIESTDEKYTLPVHTNKKVFDLIREHNYTTNDMFSSKHQISSETKSLTIEL